MPQSNKRTYTPIPWTSFFERELFLESTTKTGTSLTYHAYLTSPVSSGPLFVVHHGAGSSGLSFALLCSEIRKLLPIAGVLSIDARGHGSTTTSTSIKNEELDLRLDTLANDTHQIILLTSQSMSWPTLPRIILVGHSLGGAVVTHYASSELLGKNLVGYVVLDVVEGSAMEALQSMQSYLATRPAGFDSVEQAIEWHVRTRTIRNSTSARVSVPGLLTETSATLQTDSTSCKDSTTANEKPYTWLTPLVSTQPFWHEWFTNLSSKFLSGSGAKLLVLAGTDRLDTELMIGQMQGKYALQVFPEAGHFIQEDSAAKLAHVLVDFWERNQGILVLPPNIGSKPAMLSHNK